MPDQPIDRLALWKIENVDEIVPAGIDQDGILIRRHVLLRGMVTEMAIQPAHLQITVAQGGQTRLDRDFTIMRCVRLLAKYHVEVDRPDWENFQGRFLS